MSLIALLILAYGPLNWSFPWWLWVLAVLDSGNQTVNVRLKQE